MNLFRAVLAAAPEPSTPLFRLRGGEVVTYGETFDVAGRIATALEGMGVRPGDRVAAQTEKSWPAIALYLGCLRSGAVLVPMNTAYTASEVGHVVDDAAPTVLVVAPDRAHELSAVARPAGARHVVTMGADGAGSLVEATAGLDRRRTDADRAGDDLAALVYTSGTTGRPKGAMLTHDNLRTNAEALVDRWRFTSADVLVHALPIFHVHGLFVATNVALLAGASMVFLPTFDAEEVLARFAGSTAMMGVPTFYTRLLALPGLTASATAGMRLFVSGSAPLLVATHRAWGERTGHVILERYGMTETGMTTTNPYDGERRAGTVGRALPGVELRVVDEQTGDPAPPGQVGVLQVRGPNVFAGYWRQPERTAEAMRPGGWFVTGDLVTVDDDGYVEIVGRAKDLIISGGLNVYPKEVEDAIDALDGVRESAVIGVPHPDFGEAVVAVVARRPGAALDESTVLAGLDGHVARFKQPKRVFVVDDLPRNAMAKVQKNVLREDYRDAFGPG